MSEEQPNNPLHGLTLEALLTALVERYGWDGLAARIPVRCFELDPSIKSSLVFLRRTPWAREKVESLYTRSLKYRVRRPRPDTRPGRGTRGEARSPASRPLKPPRDSGGSKRGNPGPADTPSGKSGE